MKVAILKLMGALITALVVLAILAMAGATLLGQWRSLSVWGSGAALANDSIILLVFASIAAAIAFIAVLALALGTAFSLAALVAQAAGRDVEGCLRLALRLTPRIGRYAAEVCRRHSRAVVVSAALVGACAVMQPSLAQAHTLAEAGTETTIATASAHNVTDRSLALGQPGDTARFGDTGRRDDSPPPAPAVETETVDGVTPQSAPAASSAVVPSTVPTPTATSLSSPLNINWGAHPLPDASQEATPVTPTLVAAAPTPAVEATQVAAPPSSPATAPPTTTPSMPPPSAPPSSTPTEAPTPPPTAADPGSAPTPYATPATKPDPKPDPTPYATPATKPDPTPDPKPATATAPEDATTLASEIHVVERGESLWEIAASDLGPQAGVRDIAAAWPRWYAANRTLIGDNPHLIRPGTVLHKPGQA